MGDNVNWNCDCFNGLKEDEVNDHSNVKGNDEH